jgi:hypothetical protein
MPTVARFRVVSAVGILLVLSFIAPNGALADSITFLDVGDALSVETTSTRVFGINCFQGVEECRVDLGAPPGSIGGFTNIPLPVLGIAEPNTSAQMGSDYLVLSPPNFTTSVMLTFDSFGDSTPMPCSDSGLCRITETGGIQLAGSITWFDTSDIITATDEIFFRSDVTEVPEPSSMIEMFGVLAAFGVRLHKKASILIS